MTPLDDPRPFAQVLADWMARHKLTYDIAAPKLGWARRSLAATLQGHQLPRHERAMRALMTMIDEGRA